MKSSFFQIIILAYAFIVQAAASPHNNMEQNPLVHDANIPNIRLPGNNGAFYGPIPKEEQVFAIGNFEVAPLPIPVSQIFFTLLTGYIPPSKASLLNITDATLATATLTVTNSLTYPNGTHSPPWGGTIPLKTFSNPVAHFSIRNGSGAHVDFLTVGHNEIITDYWLPGMYIETGTWTFEFVARIPERGDVCLFAFRFTQWLEGKGSGWSGI